MESVEDILGLYSPGIFEQSFLQDDCPPVPECILEGAGGAGPAGQALALLHLVQGCRGNFLYIWTGGRGRVYTFRCRSSTFFKSG